jgi:hypothetical protein
MSKFILDFFKTYNMVLIFFNEEINVAKGQIQFSIIIWLLKSFEASCAMLVLFGVFFSWRAQWKKTKVRK